MLMELERRNLGGRLKGSLKQAHLSESLPLAVTLDQIAEKHFPLDEGNKAQKNASRKFQDLVAETLAFEDVAGYNADLAFAWFAENRAKEIENLVRRLSRHEVLGHYFLEKIAEGDDTAKGYVCLLREVVTLPRSIAERIGKGLDRNTYKDLCVGDTVSNGLTIGQDDLSMPIIEIGSPTIEHILQSFAQLFGRIGVADPADEVIGGIVRHCISAEKGSEE